MTETIVAFTLSSNQIGFKQKFYFRSNRNRIILIESIRSSKLVKYLKENFVCIVPQEDIEIDIENNESSVFI